MFNFLRIPTLRFSFVVEIGRKCLSLDFSYGTKR